MLESAAVCFSCAFAMTRDVFLCHGLILQLDTHNTRQYHGAMDTSRIDGDFQLAVIDALKARDAIYSAGFEDIGLLHGALAEAVAKVVAFIPHIQSAVDVWWADEEGNEAYPEFEDGYETAATEAYIEFLNMRSTTDRFITYAHHYNEFSNSLYDMSSFCANYDSDRGTIDL